MLDFGTVYQSNFQIYQFIFLVESILLFIPLLWFFISTIIVTKSNSSTVFSKSNFCFALLIFFLLLILLMLIKKTNLGSSALLYFRWVYVSSVCWLSSEAVITLRCLVIFASKFEHHWRYQLLSLVVCIFNAQIKVVLFIFGFSELIALWWENVNYFVYIPWTL